MADWEVAAGLIERGLPVVSLLPEMADDSVRHAFRMGCAGVVDWHAPPHEIVVSLTFAIEGKALVPIGMIRALAGARESGAVADGPTDEELDWLRQLAQGATVAALARRASYSDREMFRRLKRVYERLGTGGRVAALVVAMERGYIT